MIFNYLYINYINNINKLIWINPGTFWNNGLLQLYSAVSDIPAGFAHKALFTALTRR